MTVRPASVPCRDPYFQDLFLSGRYDRLFQEGDLARVREDAALRKDGDTVRLAANGGNSFAIIRPRSNREGVVLMSNVLPKRATVRSRTPWTHAMRLLESWSGDTVVSPRSLEVTAVPARAGQFARARRAA